MELIVLDAKGKVGTAVSAALPQVNVTVVTDVDALGAQLKSCTVQPSTLLFVNQSDLSACSDLAARLPAIYWAQENYTADELLQAIRIGARDIWRVSDVPTEWIASLERLQDATAGFAHWANEMQRDSQTAGNIQQGMWPADATDLAGYRFSRRLLPAATLTGDFVDYFPIGVRYLTFFVADVAGHGAASALLTVVLKNISWRLQQRYGRPRFRAPGEVLVWINQQLIEQSAGMHVAMFLGVIDLRKHTLHYSSAAHFPPSLVVADAGQTKSLEQRGKPLGLFPDAKYESAAVDIAPGERVVVFSDGILELLQESDLAGKEQKLQQQAASAPTIDSLWAKLTDNVSAEDDVSLLVVERIE